VILSRVLPAGFDELPCDFRDLSLVVFGECVMCKARAGGAAKHQPREASKRFHEEPPECGANVRHPGQFRTS
jgi:hypothetical protein